MIAVAVFVLLITAGPPPEYNAERNGDGSLIVTREKLLRQQLPPLKP